MLCGTSVRPRNVAGQAARMFSSDWIVGFIVKMFLKAIFLYLFQRILSRGFERDL